MAFGVVGRQRGGPGGAAPPGRRRGLGLLRRTGQALVGALAALGALAAAGPGAPGAPGWATAASTGTGVGTGRWIVADLNGTDAALADQAVLAQGGQVLAPLDAADAVVASLTSTQVADLSSQPALVVTPDVAVSVASVASVTDPSGGDRAPAAVFPQGTGATSVWAAGDTGTGVNVAVLDTGIDPLPDFDTRLAGGVDLSGEGNPYLDSYGHGTFVAGLIASTGVSSGGAYTGEAPGAGLVSVKVAGASGSTDLASVIAGVDWTIKHAAALRIRVLNMSLGFVPTESAVLNPLDQAVQKAWNSGIVVVTSAGNAGPFNGTILSPGDDPLVITVGAVDDMGTATQSDDAMTSFSSVGPTSPDGVYKPDLVASGRSVVSLAVPGSTVYEANPGAAVGTANFVGSGTSFSTAVTTGAAALVLAAHPGDRPNDVKAALLGATDRGPVGNPLVDGHGELDAAAAVGASLHLRQSYGDLVIAGAMDGPLQVRPGDSLTAGYNLSVPGSHPQATMQFVGAGVTLPVSCAPAGPVSGWIFVPLAGNPYTVAAGSNGWVPTASQGSPVGFQGSATAPDLCTGGPMYDVSAVFWGEVTSTDTVDPVLVQFHYTDLSTDATNKWSAPSSVVPVAPAAVGATVALAASWSQSGWNPGNWTGLVTTVAAGTFGVTGLAWNGTAWNGTAWNGLAWNGTAWNGVAWNGTAWNGTAWNGTAWNGTAWNGAAWNGAAWNGGAWNGGAWNGSAWNGSAWNGSAWNGSAWN